MKKTAFWSMCLAIGFTGIAEADLITLPTDLTVGDRYRLAFVTDGTRDATSADIGDYNTFVTRQAALSSGLTALGTTWTAIGSTSTVAARDNTHTNTSIDGAGVPIYLLTNTRIADNYADLWDYSLATALQVNQYGDTLDCSTEANCWVFTGSNSDGSKSLDGSYLGATGNWAEIGIASLTDGQWINDEGSARTTRVHRFYAMSDVLEVPNPVPIPAAAWLFGSALLGVVGLGYRNRKQSAA